MPTGEVAGGPAPWERQPGESARAYAAFCVYRDLGPKRSLRDAARKFYEPKSSPNLAQFKLWSVQWRWVERSQAWDEELDRQARLAQIEAVRKMNARQARAGRALQKKALERLRLMAPDDLSPLDVVRFLTEGTKIERTAMGEPTEITQQQQAGWEDRIRALRHERGLEDGQEVS